MRLNRQKRFVGCSPRKSKAYIGAGRIIRPKSRFQLTVALVENSTGNNPFLRTILSVWGWLMVLISASIGLIIQVLVIGFTLNRDRNRMLSGRIFRRSAVLSTQLNPLWRFSLLGSAPKNLGPMVVVSNHCSHSDSFLISRVPWEMKWIGKRSLFRIPIVGWSMTLSGVFLNGETVLQLKRRWQLVRRTYKGRARHYFPEGTRSETETMLPFKMVLFDWPSRPGYRFYRLPWTAVSDFHGMASNRCIRSGCVESNRTRTYR